MVDGIDQTLNEQLRKLLELFRRPKCRRLVITPAAPEGDGLCDLRDDHTGPCTAFGKNG